MMKILMFMLTLTGLVACTGQPVSTQANRQPGVLTVQNDGTMVFNERLLPEDDVVIYPDGFGGERAAVKVRVPLKPDFYRDSITVYRE